MKILNLSVTMLVFCTTSVSGQESRVLGETAYSVVERGPHHRVWRKTVYEPGPGGMRQPRIHEYVELATGLNYQNVKGQWVDAREDFAVQPGRAVAWQGQHKVTLNYNLNGIGAIEMEMPGGQILRSHVLGLSYYDSSTDRSVLIAEVKDCVGKVAGNQVIYEDALTDFRADVRYTYSKAGFEQDVILREQPPRPEAYGLNPETTKLQVLTEFVSPPAPGKRVGRVQDRGGRERDDEDLDFGTMSMGRGKAFFVGREDEGMSVSKQWLKLDGRDILVEEVAVPDIEAGLDVLPAPTGSASLKPIPDSVRHLVSHRRSLPEMKQAEDNSGRMLMAWAPFATTGLVLDYITVNSTLTNYTFQGDMTYYISSSSTLFGTNTFEGGAVIKYAANASLAVPSAYGVIGKIVSQTAMYRPVVFTAKDDNTVGEAISGSSGNPSGYYANPALGLWGIGSQTFTNARFVYARQGIAMAGAVLRLSHGQFVRCERAIVSSGGGGAVVRNGLFCNTRTNFAATSPGASIDVQNTTFHDSAYLVTLPTYSAPAVLLTNCILANVTNLYDVTPSTLNGSYNGFFQSPTFGAINYITTSYPFRKVGGGGYYLTNDCSFRNAGTTVIDANLLFDLKLRTTSPPIAYTNETFNSQVIFVPQAQRDTDVPDLGYHYDPVDYTFGGCHANSNITFSAGTAAGWFRTSSGWNHAGYGIHLSDLKTARFEGSVTAPCCWTRLSTAQEQDRTGGYGPGGIAGWATNQALAPTVQMRFTLCSMLNGDCNHFRDDYGWLNVRAQNSEFYRGGIGGYIVSLFFTNCLFERMYLGQVSGDGYCSVAMRNCTMRGGSLQLIPSKPSYYTVKDCAFDAVGFQFSGYAANGSYAEYDYNAYTNATNPFPLGGANDKRNVVFNWQFGPLGKYYLPGNSVLINAGSRGADTAGLYHFTTQTSQTKEGNSQVDMGYHYVASDGAGNPVDTNGNGIPDYYEDANGNGIYDSGDYGEWSSTTDYVTWYVDTQGNNAYNGLAAAWDGRNGPFATINWALGKPLSGNVVNVAAGTYPENVDVRGKNVQVQLNGNVTLH